MPDHDSMTATGDSTERVVLVVWLFAADDHHEQAVREGDPTWVYRLYQQLSDGQKLLETRNAIWAAPLPICGPTRQRIDPAHGSGASPPRLTRQAHQSGDPQLVDLHAELAPYGDSDGSDHDPAEIAMPVRITYDGTRPPQPDLRGAATTTRRSPPRTDAPTGDGFKDLRPPHEGALRALLDPAAYLDAPKNRRKVKRKDQLQQQGLTDPTPSGMTASGHRTGQLQR